MQETNHIEFIAEIKEVKSYKTASNDKAYRLVLISDDPTVNTLGLLNSETLVKLRVEVAE